MTEKRNNSDSDREHKAEASAHDPLLTRVPRDITSIIKEMATPKLWLWTYCPGPERDTVTRRKLVIEADTREDAIWKLKNAAQPLIGPGHNPDLHTGYGFQYLFRDSSRHTFSVQNIALVEKKVFIQAFEDIIRRQMWGPTLPYTLEEIDLLPRLV